MRCLDNVHLILIMWFWLSGCELWWVVGALQDFPIVSSKHFRINWVELEEGKLGFTNKHRRFYITRKITRRGLTTFLWWWSCKHFLRNFQQQLRCRYARNLLVQFWSWDGFMWPIPFPIQIHRKSVLPISDYHISVSYTTQGSCVRIKTFVSTKKCPFLKSQFVLFFFFECLKKDWAWNWIKRVIGK